jgi:serine phosphatase RsbU (regulator of sigma subunit)
MLKETCKSQENDAADRTAKADGYVGNAQPDTAERSIAQALRRGLLPADLPVLTGLELAHRYYQPPGCLAGSDWHDIVPLPGDRVAIVVGDAMGQGPAAATVMVQLRAAAHVLADLDLPPDAVLSRLNRMMLKMNPPAFATCVCASLDPATGSGRIARAGHLPPVLARPEGGGVIEVSPGPPLGLGEAGFESSHITLPADATLALFTDGLVETRDRACDEGVSALQRALTGSGEPLQDTCDAAMAELGQRGEDDTTLVLARIR